MNLLFLCFYVFGLRRPRAPPERRARACECPSGYTTYVSTYVVCVRVVPVKCIAGRSAVSFPSTFVQ